MGYLTRPRSLPNLLFSLHAGALVDRRGRRRQTMLAADVGRGAPARDVPVAYAFDALTLAQLYVVAFLIGALSVLFFVSYSTLFVSLVPRERYVEASSLLNGSRAFSFVGRAERSRGLLVQVLLGAGGAGRRRRRRSCSPRLCLGADHPEEPPTETAESGHVVAAAALDPALADRARLAAARRRRSTSSTSSSWRSSCSSRQASWACSPGLLGLVLGAGAIGGVVGSILAGRIARRDRRRPDASRWAACVFPAPLAAACRSRAGRSRSCWRCCSSSEFGSGFGVMLLDIAAGVDQGGARPGPAAGPRLGRVHGRELRRAAARLAHRRRCWAPGSACGRRSGSPPSARVLGVLWLLRRRSRACASCRRPPTDPSGVRCGRNPFYGLRVTCTGRSTRREQMRKLFTLLVAFGALVAVTAATAASPTVTINVSNRTVIYGGTPNLNGTTDANATVTVTANPQDEASWSTTVKAGSDGVWQLKVAPWVQTSYTASVGGCDERPDDHLREAEDPAPQEGPRRPLPGHHLGRPLVRRPAGAARQAGAHEVPRDAALGLRQEDHDVVEREDRRHDRRQLRLQGGARVAPEDLPARSDRAEARATRASPAISSSSSPAARRLHEPAGEFAPPPFSWSGPRGWSRRQRWRRVAATPKGGLPCGVSSCSELPAPRR